MCRRRRGAGGDRHDRTHWACLGAYPSAVGEPDSRERREAFWAQGRVEQRLRMIQGHMFIFAAAFLRPCLCI